MFYIFGHQNPGSGSVFSYDAGAGFETLLFSNVYVSTGTYIFLRVPYDVTDTAFL